MTDPQIAAPGCPGTSLAEPLSVAPSPGLRPAAADAAWRRQRDVFFVDEARKTSRVTMGLGVVVQLVVFGVMLDAGYPTWRIVALGGLYVCFFLSHRLIVGDKLDPSKVAGSFIMMSVAAQLFVVGSAALTG